MLYKNPTMRKLVWRCGAGPGRHIDYIAEPNGFVDGPDGYREPFRRAGFIPVDELPPEERPSINLGMSRPGITPQAPRPKFDDSVDDDEDDVPKARSSMPDLADIPSLDAPFPSGVVTPPPLPPVPVEAPVAPVIPAETQKAKKK